MSSTAAGTITVEEAAINQRNGRSRGSLRILAAICSIAERGRGRYIGSLSTRGAVAVVIVQSDVVPSQYVASVQPCTALQPLVLAANGGNMAPDRSFYRAPDRWQPSGHACAV